MKKRLVLIVLSLGFLTHITSAIGFVEPTQERVMDILRNKDKTQADVCINYLRNPEINDEVTNEILDNVMIFYPDDQLEIYVTYFERLKLDPEIVNKIMNCTKTLPQGHQPEFCSPFEGISAVYTAYLRRTDADSEVIKTIMKDTENLSDCEDLFDPCDFPERAPVYCAYLKRAELDSKIFNRIIEVAQNFEPLFQIDIYKAYMMRADADTKKVAEITAHIKQYKNGYYYKKMTDPNY